MGIQRGSTSAIYRLQKANVAVRREVLHNILAEFGILMKLVSLIKMCLNETYGRVRVGKYLCDRFPIKNDLRKEMLYCHGF
jgi:hypothetical protein